MPNPWLLPRRQFEVYMFIAQRESYQRLVDIATALGISKTTAHHHVEKLIDKGYLIRDRGRLSAVSDESSTEAA